MPRFQLHSALSQFEEAKPAALPGLHCKGSAQVSPTGVRRLQDSTEDLRIRCKYGQLATLHVASLRIISDSTAIHNTNTRGIVPIIFAKKTIKIYLLGSQLPVSETLQNRMAKRTHPTRLVEFFEPF